MLNLNHKKALDAFFISQALTFICYNIVGDFIEIERKDNAFTNCSWLLLNEKQRAKNNICWKS